MPRVKGGPATRTRRKKVLKLAKGYFGAKHLLYRTANEQVMRSLRYSYIGRKQTKREFRKLWIARINAATRMHDLSYSKFMHGLKLANVSANRKMLSEIAIHDEKGFTAIVEIAKKALANPTGEVVADVVVEAPKAVKKATKKVVEAVEGEEKPKKVRKAAVKKDAE